VLIVAATTGYQVRAFAQAAERLGVELVYATDRCHKLDDPWSDEALPIRFHDEEASTAIVLEASRQSPLDGVLAVGDRPTVVTARVQRALGLPGHPPQAAAIARNKLSTRERMRAAGLPAPWFVSVPVAGDLDAVRDVVRFPCVLKPLALSGSRGVMRADDWPALRAAFRRLRALLESADIRGERDAAHETALIEGFIEGPEFALEGVMEDGALVPLALFDKPDPLEGPFFEETIYRTPSSAPAEVQRAIVEAVASAAGAIGLHHGPVHAECRVNGCGAFTLEVAGRPIGGLCARALRFVEREGVGCIFPGRTSVGSGEAAPAAADEKCTRPLVSLEEVLLRHALGEDAGRWSREPDASGVMMIPIPRRGVLKGVAGVDNARRIAHIEDVRITAKPDQVLVPLPEGASYLGFIFARAAHGAPVERALRAACACLDFDIEPEVPVLQSRHG
jgi:hypothetical protein